MKMRARGIQIGILAIGLSALYTNCGTSVSGTTGATASSNAAGANQMSVAFQNQNTQISPSIWSQNSASITPLGGTPPYSYSLVGGPSDATIDPNLGVLQAGVLRGNSIVQMKDSTGRVAFGVMSIQSIFTSDGVRGSFPMAAADSSNLIAGTPASTITGNPNTFIATNPVSTGTLPGVSCSSAPYFLDVYTAGSSPLYATNAYFLAYKSGSNYLGFPTTYFLCYQASPGGAWNNLYNVPSIFNGNYSGPIFNSVPNAFFGQEVGAAFQPVEMYGLRIVPTTLGSSGTQGQYNFAMSQMGFGN